MILAITGHMDIEKCHNLKQIDNSEYDKNVYDIVYNDIYISLVKICELNNIDFDSLELVSGMARGVDEIFALIAIKNNLKLTIIVPKNIEYHKNKIIKKTPLLKIQAIGYEFIIKYDKLKVIEVNEKLNYKSDYGYFIARNQKMVEYSDKIISYQCYQSTGTLDCIERAKIAHKYLGNIKNIDAII